MCSFVLVNVHAQYVENIFFSLTNKNVTAKKSFESLSNKFNAHKFINKYFATIN
jgi:hypothetical protein